MLASLVIFFFLRFITVVNFQKPQSQESYCLQTLRFSLSAFFKQVPVVKTAGEKKTQTNKAEKMIERNFSIQNTTWQMAYSQCTWGFILSV